MASNKGIVIAFDLYGTLLSTESIAEELATHFGEEKAQAVAASWRNFQLEYTWRMNSMNIYKPFSEVTRASLQHALSASSETLSDENIVSLMKAYDSLDTFPDVAPGLRAIASDPSISAYVFSNGTDSMVTSSVKSSPSLSPHAATFKDLITVQEIGVFKPNPRVYQYLAKKVGKENNFGDVWLVSGNPFDVVGARVVGMQAAWVDRGGKGWVDRLGTLTPGGEPTIVVDGVEGAVNGIKRWAEKNAVET
ncbi:hypothetical protein QTJ16_002090 [Diplocarpon rosae]|uniref:Haloacid dehalogenase n=1 Tax=Diplocarpon rosae TaxID=946125 RepID=A0AAD9T586_9HELO|nr:hypothetical protein QTJ16_002090 [Diplocarpon rosae]PBP23046.1 hypothetical protein BUE80_DR005700 [Diplocarpon rosae]